MSKWIELLSSDDENDPLPDDVTFENFGTYDIEVFYDGTNEEVFVLDTVAQYFEGPDLFITDYGDMFKRYDIWRCRKQDD